MKTEVRISKHFVREAKVFLKKYPSFHNDLSALKERLLQNPLMGTALGKGVFKIRMAIKSKGKGKSGGARVISHVGSEIIKHIQTIDNVTVVTLITVYDKSEIESLSPGELNELVKNSLI